MRVTKRGTRTDKKRQGHKTLDRALRRADAGPRRNVTLTGALYCPRCRRIRLFWYAGQREVEHITRGNARGEFMVPRRVVGLFYA